MTARGFTLVELVMVTAIVAVMAAIAIPRYGSSIANMRVQMAARKLAADLQMVQSQARAASASRSIEFAPAAGGYRVPQIAGLDGAAGYRVSLSDDPYRSTFSVSFDGAGDDNTIIFDGYGAPDRGATVHISSGGTSRTVQLSRGSGSATITSP